MQDIEFAVLGTGGIGRRALEYATEKTDLTPVAACDRPGVAIDPGTRDVAERPVLVAACDRPGVAIDHDGLDVDELLAATGGNVASDDGAT